MILYTVKQGDSIDSIAYEYGFFPDTIWNLSENAALKFERKNPNVLFPGDQVRIPDRQVKYVNRQSEQEHIFVKKNTPKLLRVQFLEQDESPTANVKLILDIDGQQSHCQTDAEGWLKKFIVPNAKRAKIVFENGKTFNFNLGHLNPIDSVPGVLQRLSNLGYYAGPITSEMDTEGIEAVRLFQQSKGIEATGIVDSATESALLELSND